jgi:membrane protein
VIERVVERFVGSFEPGDCVRWPMRALRLVWAALQRFLRAGGMHQGAAVAFYAAFSIAPLLVVVAGVLVWMLGNDVAQSTLLETVSRLIGEQEAHSLSNMLAHRSVDSIGSIGMNAAALSSWIALGTALLGATGVFIELRAALQAMLGESAQQGWRRIVGMRVLAFGLVVACGVVLPIATLAQAGGMLALHWELRMWPQFAPLFEAIEVVWSWAVITVLFGFIMRWLALRRVRLNHALTGAALSAALFMLGRFAIGAYIGATATHAALGAAGAFAALLLWVYWSSQIFLLGSALAIELDQPASGRARNLANDASTPLPAWSKNPRH